MDIENELTTLSAIRVKPQRGEEGCDHDVQANQGRKA
jgi:hypothetical protein